MGVLKPNRIGYTERMDILSLLRPGALMVVCAPHAARDAVSELAAELALSGSLTVLDGGNRFQPYRLAYLLRRRTRYVDQAARRIFIRRAFTCYQMLALLQNTPAVRQPILLIDFLAGFHDEQVRPGEVERLVEMCLREVDRLSRFAPFLITLSPAPLNGRVYLLERICAKADHVIIQNLLDQTAIQPALFLE